MEFGRGSTYQEVVTEEVVTVEGYRDPNEEQQAFYRKCAEEMAAEEQAAADAADPWPPIDTEEVSDGFGPKPDWM